MRRISHCIPMRRMGTRNFNSTPELHLVVLLLFPMRCMGTHPGCGASSSDSTQLPSITWDRDAAHLALHTHAAHGNEGSNG